MLIRNKLTLLFTGIMLAIQVAFTGFVYTFYAVYREQGVYCAFAGESPAVWAGYGIAPGCVGSPRGQPKPGRIANPYRRADQYF